MPHALEWMVYRLFLLFIKINIMMLCWLHFANFQYSRPLVHGHLLIVLAYYDKSMFSNSTLTVANLLCYLLRWTFAFCKKSNLDQYPFIYTSDACIPDIILFWLLASTLKAVTWLVDLVSNGRIPTGGRVLRQCLWRC
jgi:hypothetical protein